MSSQLPDGLYPFVDRRLPLSELVMVEAPADLEKLFFETASANNLQLVRGEPVEITCSSKSHPDAVFLIFWPENSEKIHMLVPIEHVRGRV
jgi:hypothetical protein